MLDHHHVERRVHPPTPQTYYHRSSSLAFRHQPSFTFDRAIIGRSFGPFHRCASVNPSSSSLSQSQQSQSSFRRQKSIGEHLFLNVKGNNANDKLLLVTSTDPPTTQPAIESGGGESGTAPQQQDVAKTEEIDAANKSETKTKEPPPATDYKFLRRQFSMDQRRPGGGLAVTGSSSRWRGSRFEAQVRKSSEKILDEEDLRIAPPTETVLLAESVKECPHSDRNRINLNIVLRGDEDTENNSGDTETISGILKNSEVDKTRQIRNNVPTATGRKVIDNLRTRRPPLVRAMSAPIRSSAPQTNSTQRTAAAANSRNNRVPKRTKRVLPGKEEVNLRQSFTSVQIKDHDESDDEEFVARKSSGDSEKSSRKSSAKGKPRATTFTCDQIVTLVSLLDSGGSDSEDGGEKVKKEADAGGVGGGGNPAGTLEKAPTLRKAGKSVSFQENANQNHPPSTNEFSLMFRRGSVAPLAARIRAHRPPTAPPGSIFIRNETSDFRMARRPSVAKVEQPPKSSSVGGGTETENGSDPAVVGGQTAKERECWKLFQKMTTRGIAVSYDTILRGMLTPTELRIIQKQRDQEQARQEAAANETSGG